MMMKSRKRVKTIIHLGDVEEQPTGFQGWIPIMRKFTQSHIEECKAIPEHQYQEDRPLQTLCTGSTYEGSWVFTFMSGCGTYTLSHGAVYEGDMKDGMFHGEGTLTFSSGYVMKGNWVKGEIFNRNLFFPDGLKYFEDWDYCKVPDRRFSIEYEVGVQPAGQSLLTENQPTMEIPDGYYDSGDGFFHKDVKAVFLAHEITRILRHPGPNEQQWILNNCRTGIDAPLGPRQELYETWTEPLLSTDAAKTIYSKHASTASKCTWYDCDELDDGWRLKFCQSRARLSIVASRSVAEFGARQQKSRFQWDVTVKE